MYTIDTDYSVYLPGTSCSHPSLQTRLLTSASGTTMYPLIIADQILWRKTGHVLWGLRSIGWIPLITSKAAGQLCTNEIQPIDVPPYLTWCEVLSLYTVLLFQQDNMNLGNTWYIWHDGIIVDHVQCSFHEWLESFKLAFENHLIITAWNFQEIDVAWSY